MAERLDDARLRRTVERALEGDAEDAQDATQEILLTAVTHLSSFEGRSKVSTWVYTIAARHLARSRSRAIEDSVKGPEAFAAWLDRNRATTAPDVANEVELQELESEVRIACTLGMLLCLTRDARLVYILGDVVGLTAVEGAEVMATSPAAFRKRLERARATMRGIIANRCGLIRPENPCRCSRQIESSLEYGLVERGRPAWAVLPRAAEPAPTGAAVRAAVEQLDDVERLAELYQAGPEYRAPTAVMSHLRERCPDLLGA